jgi:hypothetical protein
LSTFAWFHQIILDEALWSFTLEAGELPQIAQISLFGPTAGVDM